MAIILLSILAVAMIAAVVYCYQCIHYWQADYKKTLEAGFVEQEVTLPDGFVIITRRGRTTGMRCCLSTGRPALGRTIAGRFLN